MIQQIKKDYKLIKNKGNFVKRLSEKINRSEHTIKVHYFGHWNIPSEMQPIIHEHVFKELERQKTLDFTVDEMLEEIASYKHKTFKDTCISVDYNYEAWFLSIKEKITSRVPILVKAGKTPREACLNALKYIKENPELFTKKININIFVILKINSIFVW